MLLGLMTSARVAWAGVRSRLRKENGAVATEYALLLVLIALAIIAAATALGLAIAGVFDSASGTLGGVGGGGGGGGS